MTPRSRGRQLVTLLGLGVVMLGCASAQRYAAPSRSISQGSEQRGLLMVWPPAARQADAADSVVVLEAPPPPHAARRVVQGFFEAVRRESIGDLSALLSDDATISSGPGSAAEAVPKVWAARFKRLDYAFSGAKHPYRSDELGFFTKDQLLGLRPLRRFELWPEADELLAVIITRDRRKIAGPRHFGRRMEFVLGSSPSGLRIRRIFEDFRPP